MSQSPLGLWLECVGLLWSDSYSACGTLRWPEDMAVLLSLPGRKNTGEDQAALGQPLPSRKFPWLEALICRGCPSLLCCDTMPPERDLLPPRAKAGRLCQSP